MLTTSKLSVCDGMINVILSVTYMAVKGSAWFYRYPTLTYASRG